MKGMDILTVTFNPCLDRTLWVNEHGEKPHQIEAQTGGKGVNVARVLGNLGVSAVAVCPVGGETGAEFARLARSEGISLHAVAVQSPTRVIDTYVREGDYDQRIDYARGEPMTEAELDAFDGAIDALLPSARAVAICGSASCAAAAKRVPGIISRAKALGIPVLLDSNGPALTYGAEALPDLVKPNQAELFALTGVQDAARAARALVKRGIKSVLVSIGADGCCYVTEDAEVYCPAPRVQTVNAVGAGDSFVAGFLYASVKGYALETALMIACAAGAANAAMFPAARVTKRDVEAVLGWELDSLGGCLFTDGTL